MKHINITIRGKVQAIGFRFSAMEKAFHCGINGFAKNNGSDMVFIEAEGTPEMLDAFVAWCHRGPMGARVENVLVEESPMKNFSSFDIVARDFVSE
ncbi:MAG: acylphosphatase [Bacteroidetes bacterium]|nr:acylphosphatase [Bacteroidota bacterium]